MKEQQQLDYERVEKAIAYVVAHYKEHPSLEQIARHIGLNTEHFQKMFVKWAGVSPKKFLNFTTLAYAKSLLKHPQAPSLFDAADELGMKSTGRLHNLFVNIEGMTPGEYKSGGENLKIQYQYYNSCFGKLIIANTSKGICHVMFYERENEAFNTFKQNFPNAQYEQVTMDIHLRVVEVMEQSGQQTQPIQLHIKGTPFQFKVWEALLKIPVGELETYGGVAESINRESASRAVGTAIGKNPVAYLIPCHRVIQASGNLGGYMWGPNRKRIIIAKEGISKLK